MNVDSLKVNRDLLENAIVFNEDGKGPLRILGHGLWETWEAMYPLGLKFVHRTDARVILIDFRKAEETVSLEQNYRVALKVAKEASDHFGLAPHYVGHSKGGLVGLMLAARTDLLAFLSTINSAPPLGVFPPWRAVLSTLPKYLIKLLTHDTYQIDPKDLWRLEWQETSQTFLKWRELACLEESSRLTLDVVFSTSVTYSAIDCPVIVIGATDDKICGGNTQRKLASKLRRNGVQVEFREFDGDHMNLLIPDISIGMSKFIETYT